MDHRINTSSAQYDTEECVSAPKTAMLTSFFAMLVSLAESGLRASDEEEIRSTIQQSLR